MPEPQMTEIGGWIYDALRPLADPYDEARGYPLAAYADGAGGMLQEVYDIVKDPTAMLDPDRTKASWLGWLGQFVGAGVSGSRGRIADLTNLIPHPSFEDGLVGTTASSGQLGHNYVTNPSFEVDATGYTLGTGDTLVRDASDHVPDAGGSASGLVATNGDVNGEGPYQVLAVPASTTYTFSAWVKGVAGGELVNLQLEEQDSTGAVIGDTFSGAAVALSATQWTRLSVTRTFGATGVKALIRVRTAGAVAAAVQFRIDGLMLSESSQITPFYADGDTPGWVWSGTPGKSASNTNNVAGARVTTDWARFGQYSYRYSNTRMDGTSIIWRTPTGTGGVPVTPGAYYTAMLSTRQRLAAYAGTQNIRCRIYWYKADGTSSSITVVSDGSWITDWTPGQTYDLNTGVVQAPADAAFAAVSLLWSTSTVPFIADADIDAVALFKLTGPTDNIPDYGDGSFQGWIWNGPANNATSSLMRDESDDELRTRLSPQLKDPPARRRGTVPAILDAVRDLLVDGSAIYYNERVGGNWKVGTIAINAGSEKVGVTLAQVQTAVNEIKPAGSQITVSELTGNNWQAVRDTHTDWNDVRSTFLNWAEVKSNPTKQ